jgi:RNA polymerase sigma factor (TIGR02999 family)
MPLVYDQLRMLARRYIARNRPATLRATELVHETYLRLAQQGYVEWQNREHLIGLAATTMRRVLVDRARRRHASKRGAGESLVSIDDVPEPAAPMVIDLLAFESALATLSAMDARQAQIVELRIFGGQSIDETAGLLGVSPATVKREWRLAKAWLWKELRSADFSRDDP